MSTPAIHHEPIPFEIDGLAVPVVTANTVVVGTGSAGTALPTVCMTLVRATS